jgi:hypothetical protein
MTTDSTFWRRLRGDFEGLQPGQFSLIWSSHRPMNLLKRELLQSRWTWWRFPDESLRARLRAIALRGARALGHDSEDAWFDELREADFVKFKFSGQCREKQPDGSMLEPSDGSLDDVLKHSITLCHILEADGAESFPKVSSRSKCAAQGGFTKPVPPQPDSPTAVNCGNEQNWSRVDWDAIEITFLSDERVQIRNGANTETRNYAELEFADLRVGRGKPKPNLAWATLRAMAEQNGVIRDGAKTGADWPKVERRMQEIRKALRKHFGIAADPVPFLDGRGYQACFKICCGPSFHT